MNNNRDIIMFKVRGMIFTVVILKVLDMALSYYGMTLGLHEVNPLPLFFIVGFIFIFIMLLVSIFFEKLYSKASLYSLKLSLFCLISITVIQLLFILNNIILILRV